MKTAPELDKLARVYRDEIARALDGSGDPIELIAVIAAEIAVVTDSVIPALDLLQAFHRIKEQPPLAKNKLRGGVDL